MVVLSNKQKSHIIVGCSFFLHAGRAARKPRLHVFDSVMALVMVVDWAWGQISATKLQKLADCAYQDQVSYSGKQKHVCLCQFHIFDIILCAEGRLAEEDQDEWSICIKVLGAIG